MTEQEARDEREAFEEWSFQHRPILSMQDGSIASCKCMDRVFVNGQEDWDQHIADALIAAGYREHPEPEATEIEARAALEEAIAVWDDARRHGKRGGRAANAIYEAMDAYRAAILAAGYRKHLEPEGAPQVALVMSGRQAGKTSQMVDALLDRANERGIAVKIIESQTEVSDTALIDLWWKTCSDEWAIPDSLMIAFGRAVIEQARR